MSTVTRRTAVATLLVLLVACGGNEPVAGPTPNGTTSTPPSTTTPTSTPLAGNAVAVLDNQYQPAELAVSLGTAVVWMHQGAAAHTVTAKDATFDSNPSCPADLSACMNTGDVFRFTFSRAGRFDYHCKIHGDLMSGTIVVQ